MPKALSAFLTTSTESSFTLDHFLRRNFAALTALANGIESIALPSQLEFSYSFIGWLQIVCNEASFSPQAPQLCER
jgi:hypothetical protein